MRNTRPNAYTLVEVLLVLALSATAMAFAYRIFSSQQRLVLVEDHTVSLDQELRATLDRMVREIRMAGFDPRHRGSFGFQHLAAIGAPDYGRTCGADSIAFYSDSNGNGGLDALDAEQVAFRLNVAQDGSPLNATGRRSPDHVLRRYSCGAVKWQPMAANIELLRFTYCAANTCPIPENQLSARLNEIRYVHIVLIGRAERKEQMRMHRSLFRTLDGRTSYTAPGDGYRRQLVETTVTCRNSGGGS